MSSDNRHNNATPPDSVQIGSAGNNTDRISESGATGLGAPSQADRDTFAVLVLDYCRERHGELTFNYCKSNFTVTEKATGVYLSLSNCFSEYLLAGEGHRQEIIAKHVDMFVAYCTMLLNIPSSFPDASERLFPVLFNRWSNDISRLDDSQEGRIPLLCRPLTDNLVIAVAIDLPSTVAYVTQDIPSKWAVEEDVIFTTAIGNMRKLLADRLVRMPRMARSDFAAQYGLSAQQLTDIMQPIQGRTLAVPLYATTPVDLVSYGSLEDLGFAQIRGATGLFVAAEADMFSLSRILVNDWIRMLPVKGDPVAVVSQRGYLMVTGADDTDALLRMAEMVDQVRGQSSPVSSIPLRLTSRGWETYLPPKGHPAHDPFKNLQYTETTTLYAYQKSILQQRPNLDAFVTSCIYTPNADARIGTVATWGKDVRSLLPKTDWVAFVIVATDKSTAEVVPPVPWDDVLSIVGHRMELTEFSPPRYLTKGFPSDAELDRLCEAGRRAGFPLPGTKTSSQERQHAKTSSHRQQRRPDKQSRAHRRRENR